MKQLGQKLVLEYKYDSEEEAQRHENLMKSQGWNVESKTNYFIHHFRSYSQRQREGSYL